MLHTHSSFSNFDERWEEVIYLLSDRFGKRPDLKSILFLIGVQELGQLKENFTKEEKQDLIHVGICTVLSRSGYYELIGIDKDGWPHWRMNKALGRADIKEQEMLLKEHVVLYFEEMEVKVV